MDAWSKGWIGIELVDGRFAGAHAAPALGDLIESNDYTAITVDIPLGLLDSGFREADIESALILGPRRSSVFRTPPRPVLLEQSFEAANARHRELIGIGLSQQSYALRTRLLEANELNDDRGTLRLYEVHPEVSFTMMGNGPASMSKKTWHGQRDRIARLESNGIVVPTDLGAAAAASPDDILDAAAAAWSAHRIATNVSGSLPNPPQINERGQRVAIWY